jgi:hypothetical protein
LVLKLVHSNLSNLLKKELKKHSHLKETYNHHTNFTNSTGLTAVSSRLYEYVNKKDKTKNKHIDIGIQLQGNQFRYYLSSSGNIRDLNIKLAAKLFEDGSWFCNVNTNKPLSGKGRSKRADLQVKDNEGNPRTFCEYSNGGFLYFYQDVYENNQMPTIEEIVNMFVSAFEHYETNKPRIQEILNDILIS